MSVHVLIVTHEEIGQALLNAINNTFSDMLPYKTNTFPVPRKINIEETLDKLGRYLSDKDHKDGVLILTDLFGATPCNLIRQLQKQHPIAVVSGINLPMLIRIMNYPHLTLEELATKAVSGGKDGIIRCKDCEND